jgi:hypothetical protein
MSKKKWDRGFELTIKPKEKSRQDLRKLLCRLGIRSAEDKLALRMEDLEAAVAMAQVNFGMPDRIIMSERHIAEFSKLFNK